MTATPALVFEGVSKSYGAVPAARDLDLSVHPGEMVTLIGPSGCGKSTALRLIAGLERPDAGRILVAGEEVAGPRDVREPGEAPGRAGLPGPRAVPAPDRHPQRRVRAARRARAAPRPSGPPGPPRCSSWSGWATWPAATRTSCPAGSSSGWRWPVPSRPGRPSYSSTSRSPASTRTSARRSAPSSVGVLRETGTTAIFVTHDQTEALSIGDRVVGHAGRADRAGGHAARGLRGAGHPLRRLVHGRRRLPAGPRPPRAAHLRDRGGLDGAGLGRRGRRRRRGAAAARGGADPRSRVAAGRGPRSSRSTTTVRSCCTRSGWSPGRRCARGSRTRCATRSARRSRCPWCPASRRR